MTGTRPGHHRPVGTVTAPQRFQWTSRARGPELGDVAVEVWVGGEGADVIRRAYLVVGVEETSSAVWPYRLLFERLEWDDATARVRRRPAAHWAFHKLPR